MTNRITTVEQSSQPDPQSRERLARFLGRLIRGNPPIIIEPFEPGSGNVVFAVKLADLRTTPADYKRVAFYRTKTLGNFVSEFLIRQNLHRFSDLIGELPSVEFEDAARRYVHNNAGVCLYSDRLEFEVHLSLLHKMLNEELFELIRTVPE